MTDTTPVIPAVPSTTPAWLTRAASVAVSAVGVGLAKYSPSGAAKSPTVQLVLVLAFLAVAFLVFFVTETAREVRLHGWTKAAATAVVAADAVELRALLVEAKPLIAQVKPVLDKLPAVAAVEERVSAAEALVKSATERVEAAIAKTGVKVSPEALVDAVRAVLSGGKPEVAPVAPVVAAVASEPVPAPVAP